MWLAIILIDSSLQRIYQLKLPLIVNKQTTN
jgi:hypothetical protein